LLKDGVFGDSLVILQKFQMLEQADLEAREVLGLWVVLGGEQVLLSTERR
jgi:hypothetical protein